MADTWTYWKETNGVNQYTLLLQIKHYSIGLVAGGYLEYGESSWFSLCNFVVYSSWDPIMIWTFQKDEFERILENKNIYISYERKKKVTFKWFYLFVPYNYYFFLISSYVYETTEWMCCAFQYSFFLFLFF